MCVIGISVSEMTYNVSSGTLNTTIPYHTIGISKITGKLVGLMPMTHVTKIGAENPYEKTGAINRQEKIACSIRYRKLLPEKFGTKVHARRVRFPGSGFFCADFW